MYRWATKRILQHQLLLPSLSRTRISPSHIRSSSLTPLLPKNPFYYNHNSWYNSSSNAHSPHTSSESATSSSTTEGGFRDDDNESGSRGGTRAQYKDEQARVLGASLRLVPMMGWTETAMIAGAREAGVSPSIIGSFPRKEAALVEFFMDECLQKLIDTIDSDQSLRDLIPSDRISKLLKIRLELQAPFISKWAQALSIQAQPQNMLTSFKQRAMLVDEIWHAAGDEGTDMDWYARRTLLGAIYSTTEVYMLTDKFPDFRDTWAFLDNRVKDAFDLKKSFQEAKYLADAVGAGMGSSVQGFMNSVFQR